MPYMIHLHEQEHPVAMIVGQEDNMHPITVIEITASVICVVLLFIITMLIPKKARKISLFLVLFITLVLISWFAVRPYWIDYKVSIKTEQLNLYLKQRYPNQEWKIDRKVGRQYNPYSLDVTFENEKDWTYSYLVRDNQTISQNGYSVPDGKSPEAGQHHETTGQ
jgi:hypothetical protein